MSRIGRKPIEIKKPVTIKVNGLTVDVEGPKGKLSFDHHPRMKVSITEDELLVERPTEQPKDRALHGMTRAIIANMVVGVTDGYKKEMEIHGVGMRAKLEGKFLELSLGFSHPILHEIPEGITVQVPKQDRISVSGIDKQKVGQTAAEIRHYYEPEPYKGKGIRYVGEHVRRKQGKAAG